jgi:recombination protein RecT
MTTAQIVPQKDALGTTLDMLTRLKPQMRAALPKHLSPERMVRIITTTLRRTPRLLECTPVSLAGAIIQSCQLGLEPDGFLGEFYLTPRRIQGIWNVVGITGWRGMAKLARQSGDVDWIMAHAVYKGDDFTYEYGDTPKLVHKPGTGPQLDSEITHFYAVARLASGSPLFWVMTKAEVDQVRDRYAAAKDDGPWVAHYAAMGCKTALRRLCKHLPQSTSLGRAVALDEAAEAGLPQGLEALVDTDELGLPEKASNLARIGEALEASRTPAAEAEAGPPPGQSHAPASRPPGRRRDRFPRIPQDVEQPVSVGGLAADTGQPLPAPSDPNQDPDAPSHTFPPRTDDADVTASNAFELLKLATTEAELDRTVERVHASEVFRAWNDSQRQLFREAVNLTRKRLPS